MTPHDHYNEHQSEHEVTDAIDRYREIRATYHAYASKVRDILMDDIPADCPVHSIDFRAKSIDSFRNKACKVKDDGVTRKYTSPLSEITDLAGIRVIVFFPKSLALINRAIANNFDITWMKDLGEERISQGRFGYKSIHYLVKLKADRTRLSEYRKFKGLTAEIQVRTILQHAWAEMEHDIQYKSTDQIPASIQRRFISLAGMLEIADREFQAIQDEDSSIRASVKVSLEDDLTRSALSPTEIERTLVEKGSVTSSDPESSTRNSTTTNVRLLLSYGKYTEAVKLYSKMIDLQPLSYTLYIGRAKARFLAGDRTGAIEDLEEAKRLNPDDSSSDSVRLQIEEGRPLTVQPPQEAWQFANRANDALAAGHGEEAFELYSKAQELGLNKFFALYNKAMACTLVNDLEGAKYFLDQINIIDGTPTQINVLALRLVIEYLEENPSNELSDELASRLMSVGVFDCQQSPIRHLRKGMATRSPATFSTIKPVFDKLEQSGSTLAHGE